MDTYAAKLLILILRIICEINEEKLKKNFVSQTVWYKLIIHI